MLYKGLKRVKKKRLIPKSGNTVAPPYFLQEILNFRKFQGRKF